MRKVQNTVWHPRFGYNWHPARLNEAVPMPTTLSSKPDKPATPRGPMSTPAVMGPETSGGFPQPLNIKDVRIKHVAAEAQKRLVQKPKPKSKSTMGKHVYGLKQLLKGEVDSEKRTYLKDQLTLYTAAIKGRKWAVQAIEKEGHQQPPRGSPQQEVKKIGV